VPGSLRRPARWAAYATADKAVCVTTTTRSPTTSGCTGKLRGVIFPLDFESAFRERPLVTLFVDLLI